VRGGEFKTLDDAQREIDFEKTNLALGNPVDVEKLFRIFDVINDLHTVKWEDKVDELEEQNGDLASERDEAEYQVEELERKLRELRGGDKQKPIDVSKLRK
jgi:FtsZ-binding cell division protein ZapB